MSTCPLCENPYPYNCEHCIEAFHEEPEPKAQPVKKFIGSGEDVCLEEVYAG